MDLRMETPFRNYFLNSEKIIMEMYGSQRGPVRDYFLTSERLGFRHWRTDDLPLARALWGNDAVTALIGGPFTAEQVEQRLSREIASMRDLGVQYWPMFLLETQQHAGCAGLR